MSLYTWGAEKRPEVNVVRVQRTGTSLEFVPKDEVSIKAVNSTGSWVTMCEVVVPASPVQESAGLTLVTPDGFRIEGLSAEAAAALV